MSKWHLNLYDNNFLNIIIKSDSVKDFIADELSKVSSMLLTKDADGGEVAGNDEEGS